MQDALTDSKITILLHALDFQTKEIQRRQDREQQIFQWSTSLLLGVFGVVIALSDRAAPLPAIATIKLLATLMVILPVLFSIFWIRRLSQQAANNAEVVERVEGLLHLFRTDYFGDAAPYPENWEGKLKQNLQRRKTPLYYAALMVSMTACVVAAIWLVL